MRFPFNILIVLCLSACGGEPDEELMLSVGGRWACEIEKQYECTREGCTQRDRPPKIIVDFDAGEVSRCMARGCDAHPFKFQEDPLLSVLVGKIDRARGAYFVVDSDGTNFVESVSQGAWTISSFGNCEPETATSETPPKKAEKK